ncbi:MAG: ribonuclease HI family protein [Patescibacteria group bacterium]
MQKIIINIDGGSRGNPGPAAFGVVFSRENGVVVKSYGETMGIATNNEAEYGGLIFALKKAKQIFGKENIKQYVFEIKSDSELLVRQMQHRYKINGPKIQPLFLEAWNLLIDFSAVNFTAIPREQNSLADRLVNEALDKKI